jgi:hypothetical protein
VAADESRIVIRSQGTVFHPRYVAYARAHGKTPAEMLAHDEQAWPGGKMCGFMLWISGNWRAWQKFTARRNLDVLTEVDHASFDAFISTTPEQVAA